MLIINKNYITKKFIFETDKHFQKYTNKKTYLPLLFSV